MRGDSEGKGKGAKLVGEAAVEAVHKPQCSGGGQGERNLGMCAGGGIGLKRGLKKAGAVVLNIPGSVLSEEPNTL